MQVKLTSEDVETLVPIESLTMMESLNSFYFYFQIVTQLNIFGYVTLTIEDKVIPCYVVKSMSSGMTNSVTSILISKKQKDSFNVLASPYIGDCNVGLLINSVGLSGREYDESETFHWIVRESSCYDFMRYVSKFAKTKQGGAPYLVMDFDGDIRYYDAIHRQEYGDVIEIDGAIRQRSDDFQYQLPNPTNIDLVTYTDGTEDVSPVNIGSSRGLLTVTPFNDYAQEYYFNYNSNLSWKTMVDRTILTIETIDDVRVGCTVQLRGLPIKGVVMEVMRPFPLYNNHVLPTQIKVSCQLYELKS